jgi:nucleotidyltransferase substrate binding protein (TIGR01987 family)
MRQDIRWRQRFQNFDRALLLLRELERHSDLNALKPVEQEGFIQRFEYTFELAWKIAKDYLEYSGHVISQASPRSPPG